MKKQHDTPLQPSPAPDSPAAPSRPLLLDLCLVERRVALRTWLIYHGITEKEIGARLKVSASTVTRLLSGERRNPELIARLTELGIPRCLLGEED